MIATCPQCGALVITNADDTCPHCRHPFGVEKPTFTPVPADGVLNYRRPDQPSTKKGGLCPISAILVSGLSLLLSEFVYLEVQGPPRSLDAAVGNAILLVFTTPIQFVLLTIALVLSVSGSDPLRHKIVAMVSALAAAVALVWVVISPFV